MVLGGGRSARPDPEFDALVEEVDYMNLPILCEMCKLKTGHSPTVSWMRRLLHDANNGRSPHVAAVDQAKFRREAAERSAAMQARRDERAKELELERRDDAVRIARRVQLQVSHEQSVSRRLSRVRFSGCVNYMFRYY